MTAFINQMPTPILRLSALLLGFCLDLIFGDPQWFPHIIRLIGNLISVLEKILRALFPKSDRGELVAGVFLVLLTMAIPATAVYSILKLCAGISIWLWLAAETFFCYQLLATKALKDESMKVYTALKDGPISEARRAVSMIVGRDTENLSEIEVTKATVETIAENASDGVIAPLLFLALGGSVLGIMYKSVNTMDSMVGYKNDKYMYFGRCAAKLDDALNFFPARVAGLLMCAAAGITGFDMNNAYRIFARDRLNHSSPNSAHTEAACAGALGIQLAGGSFYFGNFVQKPTIGEPLRPVVVEDVVRANKLLYATAFVALLLFCGLPLIVLLA